MLLRDAVHGLIVLEGAAEQLILGLLETREVQRLRRVRQLGLASLVFPGAEHSRFSHALGAAHVMVRLLERLKEVQEGCPVEMRMSPMDELDAVAAAFLHDVGHGPFSHLFEEVMPQARSHEAWGIDIVLDPSTDVNRVLSKLDRELPTRVAGLMQGKHRLPYLTRAISGMLDVDRCDYLLRDSQLTGVRYGIYDLDWLLRALCLGELEDGSWVIAIEGRKGLPSIEGFFIARHFMYQQVYHHKATRAAEALVRGLFARLAELLRDGARLPSAPKALRLAALGEHVGLSDYLDLDDAVLLNSLAEWRRGPDALLGEFCECFLNRRLPKTLPLPAAPSDDELGAKVLSRAREIAHGRGLREDLWVWLDVTTDIPYAEPTDDTQQGMWVKLRHQPLLRLGDMSFLLGQLRNKVITQPRLLFPEAIRSDVLHAVEGLLS
ncbi:MAG: HD domain-containing protein [Myxococcales bacterium]|nr:HD domain-containing protein [Myxococcales bacterium]MCB9708791.1 HD domain-containing protein [Myxococcales bacterium]